MDLDENGEIITDDAKVVPVAEEVPLEKRVFWNDDPSMRLTQQGLSYDQSKLQSNRFSKRTYQAMKEQQKHQASQYQDLKGSSYNETLGDEGSLPDVSLMRGFES